MKNWLTIGQLAQLSSVSQKALRIYERMGLLKAHARGENNYRYYTAEQAEIVKNIKRFKSLGFSLSEIKSLFEVDSELNPERLKLLLDKRLAVLMSQQLAIESAQNSIHKILISLKDKKKELNPSERKFIMAQLEKLSVVVTGTNGLELTAQYIQKHVSKAGKNIPVTVWNGKSPLPTRKSYVLVIAENQLKDPAVSSLNPDVVVIKEISGSSKEIQSDYEKLYGGVGPHMTTVLNADDRAVVELAASDLIRKGRTYYFSKNSGLKSQIQNIGGVVSDGQKIELYGVHQVPRPLEITLSKILGLQEETAYMASLAAVLDLGIAFSE